MPSGTKSIALGAAAVLVATIALSVLQYRSLRQLEAKTRLAVEDNLRQTLEAVAGRMEAKVRTIAAECLSPLRVDDLAPQRVERIGRQFAAIRQAHPEVAQLFVFSLCSCRGEPFAIFSAAGGARHVSCKRFDTEQESARALQAFRGSLHHSGGRAGKDELRFFQWASPAGLYAFRVLAVGNKDQEESFAGMVLQTDYVAGELLQQSTVDLERGAGAPHPAALSFAILEAGNRKIYASPVGSGNYEMKVTFGPMLPLWELAAGHQNTTIEALAREQFQKNLLLSAFVLAGLLMAIGLTVRAAARETQLAQLKSTFVANVSHEMKTPLALIRMFAETLELGRVKSGEKAQEYYRIIHNESRRLTQLIDNVLDFAKMEAGRKEYRFASADVAEVVEDVIRSYEYQIASAGFELNVEIHRNLPPVRIDASAISQAVLNLLDNAVKYATDAKKIGVCVERRGEHIALEVADRGIGIPRPEHERIFEKFYRVSNGLVHNTKGSGLGLTLTRHIVEAHGGRITVESEPGQGSRFTILLPVEDAMEAPRRAAWNLEGEPVAESADHRG